MPYTLAVLKTELTTDPRGYGYAALLQSGQDQAVADLLNLVRTGSNGGPQILIKRTDVAPAEIAVAIDVVDYTALGASPSASALSTERRYLAWLSGILAVNTVRLLNDDGTDTPVEKNFKAMFGVGTGTLIRLSALATRNGSRAEELFGRDFQVTAEEVGNAR